MGEGQLVESLSLSALLSRLQHRPPTWALLWEWTSPHGVGKFSGVIVMITVIKFVSLRTDKFLEVRNVHA